MPRGIPNKKRKRKSKRKLNKPKRLVFVDTNQLMPAGPTFVNEESPQQNDVPDSITLLGSQLLEVISQQNALIREQNTTLQTLSRIMEHRR